MGRRLVYRRKIFPISDWNFALIVFYAFNIGMSSKLQYTNVNTMSASDKVEIICVGKQYFFYFAHYKLQ